MMKTELTLPELGLLVGTRGMLGAGLGLLLADKLSDDRRKGIGWTLAAVGVLSTIPLAMMVFGDRNRRARA
jgi:hypothetical protein